MKTVFICKGLPASGKTTWAKHKVVNSQANSIKRINKDDLRTMLDSSVHTKGNEKFIIKMRDMMITEALDSGCSVIVDDTNLHPDHIKNITRMVRDRNDGSVTVIKDFTDVPLDECIKRNAGRQNPIPEGVITDMYNKYLKDRSPMVRPHDPSKSTVIICDLDGTLALIGNRSPYDASTCADDKVNEPVYKILDMCECTSHVNKIIFVSGRSDRYRSQTLDFLNKIGYNREYFNSNNLLMRKEGDHRKDCIVKEEIYREHIEPKYNVLFVLDDRDQVVQMWRKIGLTCLQVANGNF